MFKGILWIKIWSKIWTVWVSIENGMLKNCNIELEDMFKYIKYGCVYTNRNAINLSVAWIMLRIIHWYVNSSWKKENYLCKRLKGPIFEKYNSLTVFCITVIIIIIYLYKYTPKTRNNNKF